MRSYEKIKFSFGKRSYFLRSALLDTGADKSFIPIHILRIIGAYNTNILIPIKDAHGYIMNHSIYKIGIYFPNLNNIGNYFDVVACDSEECLIGHDVMGALGIKLDPETGKVSVTNKVEQFILYGLALVGGGYITSKLPNICNWIKDQLRKIKFT